MSAAAYFGVKTPIGEMRVYAHEGRPALLSLPQNAAAGAAAAPPPPRAVGQLMASLQAYFRGQEIAPGYVRELIASLSSTPFERAVLTEVARIPWGETRTYGEVAALAGYPRAARAVGNVMHGNPFPVLIPCHRVVRAGGGMGGYGGGERLKAWLLRFESSSPRP